MAASESEIDELVARYAHRVQYFTGQVQKRFMLGSRWHDELISAGYWGLFKALRNRRVDAHERELSAYVSRRVEGAVIDEARSCLVRSSRIDAAAGIGLHGLEDSSSPGTDGSGGFGSRLEGRIADREGDADPEHIVGMQRRHAAIEAALDALDPEQRAVLRAYMDGDSVPEIARALGVSPGTMQARFQKLARRVRAGAPTLRRILLDNEHV